MSFNCYAHALDRTPDLDLPDQRSVPIDLRLVVMRLGYRAPPACCSASIEDNA